MPRFSPRRSAADWIESGVTIETVRRSAYPPMIDNCPPCAEALTTGSILDPPTWISPEMMACTTLSPELKFCVSTCRPCSSKNPCCWATTTSELAKLVSAVGSPTVIEDSSEPPPPHAVAKRLAATNTSSRHIVRDACILLLPGGFLPRRDASFGPYQKSTHRSTQRYQNHNGYKDPSR